LSKAYKAFCKPFRYFSFLIKISSKFEVLFLNFALFYGKKCFAGPINSGETKSRDFTVLEMGRVVSKTVLLRKIS